MPIASIGQPALVELLVLLFPRHGWLGCASILVLGRFLLSEKEILATSRSNLHIYYISLIFKVLNSVSLLLFLAVLLLIF